MKKYKIIQLLILLIFIIIWELLTRFNIIDSFIFSSPSLIIKTIIKLYNDGILFKHIFTTLNEIIISFILGISLGFIIALIFYLYPFTYKILEPFLTILNSLPKVALGPIILIWFGANTKSIIIMALLINLFISIINIYNGLINYNKEQLKYFQSLKATKLQIVRYLILPNAKKAIISSLKINISMTLIGVIMGELLSSKNGLGYLIIYGTQIFNLNLVMTGIFLVIIISYILYQLICYIEKNLLETNNY